MAPSDPKLPWHGKQGLPVKPGFDTLAQRLGTTPRALLKKWSPLTYQQICELFEPRPNPQAIYHLYRVYKVEKIVSGPVERQCKVCGERRLMPRGGPQARICLQCRYRIQGKAPILVI